MENNLQTKYLDKLKKKADTQQKAKMSISSKSPKRHLANRYQQSRKMEKIAHEILTKELTEEVESISQIINLGSVNNVYDVKCKGGNYVVRINKDKNKEYEFWKEKWCIEKVAKLNIPSPEVLKVGMKEQFPFMVLNKIEGINGSKCTPKEKLLIWENLGKYAKIFHGIKEIEELNIATDEFHSNWTSKLEYNINELSENDSLLEKKAFNNYEQEKIRNILIELRDQKFNEGLVHGDLCPRNVIYDNQNIILLDWGSSGINIVPHSEIGLVQMENGYTENEFNSFLSGLGILPIEYKEIENEIKQLNLLDRLDKYRWADGSEFVEIDEYILKLRTAYEKLIN